MNLYNKYRPKTLDDIVGNTETVDYLDTVFNSKKVPPVFLLYGATGCGKTTLARIIAKNLKCHDLDFQEVNSANFRGIDTVRELIKNSKYHSIEGGNRVWLIDEVHKMTGDAQNAMLKLLEEPPKKMYFILCTTSPQKLLPTVRGRCMQLKVNTLSESQVISLLRTISKKEGVKINKEILEQIAFNSMGHPRNAIQILEKIIFLPPKKMLEAATQIAQEESNAIELCRALMTGSPWKKVANILKEIKAQEAESIRRSVLGYAEAVLLKSDNSRAAFILEEFTEPLYDVGWPGLVLYCYTIIKG